MGVAPQASVAKTAKLPAIVSDPVQSARLAGLRYIGVPQDGIVRRRSGRGFSYRDADNRRVTDLDTLRRIRALAIPPAWTDVWICPSPNGHVQAFGRDARGRKQYRYHARWRETRDENKYARMLAFARVLPRIRAQVGRDLARPGLPREKVLATLVRLLETTLIRIGNEAYRRANGSFGLTTLRDRHVDVNGSQVRFSFRGKAGKEHVIDVRDPRMARIVRRLLELPGRAVFQYLDENGERWTVDSSDVNAYLAEITGADFTAKDFRTWAGTVLAARALDEVREFTSAREAKRNIVRAVARVAARLGNTPAICRRSYVHPEVLQAYLDGITIGALKERTEGTLSNGNGALHPEEGVVLGLLQQRA
jgi:DNA topoisomerase I